MKIAHILEGFNCGGAELVALTLAKCMAKYHEVDFIVFNTKQHYDARGFKVHKTSLRRLEQLLLSNKYDLLIDHYHWSKKHIKILEVITKLNINFIMVDHNSFNFHLIFGDTEVHNLRFNLYKKAQRLVVLNQATKEDYKNFANIDATVIHNPLVYDNNTTKFSNLTSSNIIAVGGFHKQTKNIEALLKTFSIVILNNPFAVLHIAGEYVEQQVKDLLNKYDISDNNIFFHGILSHDDLTKLYRVASVFAMTSVIEGFPMVLLEAAQHKLPIVAMDIRGVTNELFKNNEDAFFVPQQDHQAMAAALLKLLDDKELRTTMGNSAYNKVQSLTIDKIGAQWLNLIDDIMQH